MSVAQVLLYVLITTQMAIQNDNTFQLGRLEKPGFFEKTSDLLRIPTPTTLKEKMILANFFVLPGVRVYHINPNYTDVKIPVRYAKLRKELKLDRERDITIIDEGIYRYVHKRGERDVNMDDINFPFHDYPTYDKIVDYMKKLCKKYSNVATVIKLEKTIEGNYVYGVLIRSSIKDANAVFLEGATHGRDWASVSAALYVMKQITARRSTHPSLKPFDWVIIPVVNPDGYMYSLNKSHLWQKNRNCTACRDPEECGVNLDRNFPFFYGGLWAGTNYCSDTFMGIAPLSQAETKSVFKITMANRKALRLYIGLRCFGSFIIYPWASKAKYVENEKVLYKMGMKAADAMYRSHQGKYENYTVGNFQELLYPMGGTLLDYAKGVLNIEYSFLIYLRKHKDHTSYTPPAEFLLPIVKECFAGIKQLAELVHDEHPPPKKNLRKVKNKRRKFLNCGNLTESRALIIIFSYFVSSFVFKM